MTQWLPFSNKKECSATPKFTYFRDKFNLPLHRCLQKSAVRITSTLKLQGMSALRIALSRTTLLRNVFQNQVNRNGLGNLGCTISQSGNHLFKTVWHSSYIGRWRHEWREFLTRTRRGGWRRRQEEEPACIHCSC